MNKKSLMLVMLLFVMALGFAKENKESNRSQMLDFIFNNQTLGETIITIRRSEWNKLCDNYRYFYKNENCVLAESYVYKKDGKTWTLKNVGFRLRGNTSRFCPQGLDNGKEQGQANYSWSAGYYAYAAKPNNDYRQSHYKVDFEEFLEEDEEQKLAGCLKGMALKRMDGSCAREIFCYDLFHKNGIWTAPRASHTRLTIKIIEDKKGKKISTINFGVYEMFEEVNKQSLKAREEANNSAANAWKTSKGNLWKCQSDLTDYSGNNMGVEDIRIFFTGDMVSGNNITNKIEPKSDRIGYVWDQYSMDLKTNKAKLEPAKTELKQFIYELNQLPVVTDKKDKAGITKIKEFYEKWFDVDFFIKTYAINMLCGMDDDYWGNANNYYLYFDTGKKGSGKVYFIPFDYDNTLGGSIFEGGFRHEPFDWGRGKNRPLLDRLVSVPEYKQKLGDYLVELSNNEFWQYERCSGLFKYWKEMIDPYLKSPDLNYTGLGVKSTYYGTWQPGGYSLVDRENNIFDATREVYRRFFAGERLTIREKDVKNYEGIVIQIENIPKEAAIRKVYINNKKIAEVGLSWNNGVATVSPLIFQSEFGYPYTEAGKEYTIKVEYENIGYGKLESSPPVTIKAKRGIGEFKLVNEPQYQITNGVLTFDPAPVLQIGNKKPSTSGKWSKYYVMEIYSTDWQYQSWNYLGESPDNFDFKVRKDDGAEIVWAKDSSLMFTLYYVVQNDVYGDYRLILYDVDDTRGFKIK